MSQSDGIPQGLKSTAGVIWRILVILAGIAVIGMIFNQIFAVVFALFFAMLVTAWTQPLMKVFHKFLPKVISMILALLVIIAAILLILYVVVSSSISEGPKLVASVTSGFDDIKSWLQSGPLHLSDSSLGNLIDQAKSAGGTVAKGFLGDALGALGSIGTIVIGGSVFLFGVIFFLMTPNTIWNWILGWMPKKAANHIDTGGHIAWDSISGYTRGIVIVALCDATLVFIGLTVLRVPLAPALAAVVFIGAFIPVIGAPIATFFAAIVALAENGPIIALLVVGLTVVVGSFDGDVLQPLVMGKAVNLHPLAIIIAIAIGSLSLGIVGALIAVPVAGALYGVLKYVTNKDPDRPYQTYVEPITTDAK